MKTQIITAFALSALGLIHQASATSSVPDDADLVERGRYLVTISGCNDCHTPGYLEGNGEVPESLWLTGSNVGFQGPWGTTYPTNLRHRVQSLTETQWVERVRQPMRPPMPWFNLGAMTDEDLKAIYRYLTHLGPAGEPAPSPAAPGVEVTTPFFDFTPKNLPAIVQR